MNRRKRTSRFKITENDLREMVLIIILCCVGFTGLLVTEPKEDIQNQMWSVECDGISIQYISPWPLPPKDVCSSLK